MSQLNIAAPKKVEPAKEPEKVEKKRAKKDPNAPKKPMPPFFCYQRQRRPTLITEQPGFDNKLLIKVSRFTRSGTDSRQGLLAKGQRREDPFSNTLSRITAGFQS